MDFKNEVKSFINNHPIISLLSLGTIPVIWASAVRLTGVTEKTDKVAQNKFENCIQIGIAMWAPGEIRPDGNDLYSAFALVFENDANMHREVRKKVAETEAHIFDESMDTGPLDEPSQKFMRLVEAPFKRRDQTSIDYGEYKRKTESDNHRGGEAEIIALTIAYPVTIHVHLRDFNGKIEPKGTTYGSGEMNVHLLLDGEIYKPLIPL